MNLHVLMITSEWPTPKCPNDVPFLVRQAEFLGHAGVDIDVFPFRGSRSPFRYFQAWLLVQSKIGKSKYDLVHAQFGQSGLLAIFPKRLPLVVTFRGSDVVGIVGSNQRYTLAGKLLQKASRLVARLADQAIVVSESLIELLPDREYHVITSGIDLSVFMPTPKTEARDQLGMDQTIPLVLFSGSKLVPRKRYGLAEEVVKIASAKIPGTRLITLDSVRHGQVPLYMNACDVMLSTSLHEGSPNMVKEALACNLPVVSTDVGDVRERMGGIEGCVVCDNDTPETIAEGLKRILRRGGRIDGRKHVLDLDENLQTQKLITVYRQAMERH